MSIQIVRIEYSDGMGIFKAKDGYDYPHEKLSNWSEFYNRHRDKFPTPINDKGIARFIHSYEYCAFKTIKQLQKWITPSELKEFVSLGFKILLLDVSEATIGQYQALYQKKHITQIKDISQLFI